MKVSSESAPDSQVVLTIEVEPPELERSMDQAYRRLVNRTLIPGFRKGKAPRSMLERYLGRSALLDEAMQTLAPKVARDAIVEQNIEAIAEPHLEITQVDPVVVKATVDVKPEIELGDYLAVRVDPIVPSVPEDAVDKALDRLRERDATWAPIERPIEFNDRATFDIDGMEGDEPTIDLKGFEYSVLEGRRDPVPGFVDQVVGLSSGETKAFTIAFPDDHEDANLKGKAIDFTVKVLDVKGRLLPELDDDFVKTLGEGLETVAALRERLERNLRLQAERDAAENTKEAAIDKLLEGAKVEAPYGMIDEEIHSMLSDQETALRRQNISFETYLRATGQTVETLHDRLKPDARERIRRRLVLDKLAEAEGIAIGPDEVNNEIADTISQSGEASTQIARLLDQPRARQTVENNLRIRKAVSRLVEIATEGKVQYPLELPEQAKSDEPSEVVGEE